jgi:hypothetical protein
MDGLQGNWTIERDPQAILFTIGNIATRAYFLWLEDGAANDDSLHYWCRAETEHLSRAASA